MDPNPKPYPKKQLKVCKIIARNYRNLCWGKMSFLNGFCTSSLLLENSFSLYRYTVDLNDFVSKFLLRADLPSNYHNSGVIVGT